MTTTTKIIYTTAACSATYLAYVFITLNRKVQCRTTPHLQEDPSSPSIPVPDALEKNSEDFIIHHERAETSISSAMLRSDRATRSALLTTYLKSTMTTFSSTPPGWAIYLLFKHLDVGHTFQSTYIRYLDFEPGERVCGVYVVRSREKFGDGKGERVVMAMDAPKGYEKPVPEGFLIADIREEGDRTVFVNHTVLWREKRWNNSKPAVLESRVGRWFHALLVRRLMDSGLQGVMRALERKQEM